MREKLIKILTEVQYLGGLEEKIADHLLANGVTVQKWIPVTERLPNVGQSVLGYTGSCSQIATYEGGCSWWTNYHGHTVTGENLFTHWIPLPPAPKEDA